MAWCSFFYQSGMSGQGSFRLPNGEDLPVPEARLWNNESANIEVDFANIPPPYRIRIHYRVVISGLGSSRGSGRTRHISDLTGEIVNFGRDQGISRTVVRNLAFYFGRRVLLERIIGAGASVTETSPLGRDTFFRLVDGDRAFTYIIVS